MGVGLNLHSEKGTMRVESVLFLGIFMNERKERKNPVRSVPLAYKQEKNSLY